MKMYTICIVALFSVIGLSVSMIKCPNGTYCKDGYKCCKASGYYTCCPNSKKCSSDGLYCNAKFSKFTSNLEKEEVCEAMQTEVFALTPADIFVLADSFLDNLGVYEFVPKTTTCGKNLSDLLPDVTALIEKILKIKSPEELIPIAITIYTELYPRVVEILKGCDGVSEELKEKLAVILAVVKAKDFFPKIVEIVQKRFSEIFVQISSAVTMFQYGNYKQAGKNAAFAVAILLGLE